MGLTVMYCALIQAILGFQGNGNAIQMFLGIEYYGDVGARLMLMSGVSLKRINAAKVVCFPVV